MNGILFICFSIHYNVKIFCIFFQCSIVKLNFQCINIIYPPKEYI